MPSVKEKIMNFMNYNQEIKDTFQEYKETEEVLKEKIEKIDGVFDDIKFQAKKMKKQLAGANFSEYQLTKKNMDEGYAIFSSATSLKFLRMDGVYNKLAPDIRDRFKIEDETVVEEFNNHILSCNQHLKNLEGLVTDAKADIAKSEAMVKKAKVLQSTKQKYGKAVGVFAVILFISAILFAICVRSSSIFGMLITGIIAFVSILIMIGCGVSAKKYPSINESYYETEIKKRFIRLRDDFQKEYIRVANQYSMFLDEVFSTKIEEVKKELITELELANKKKADSLNELTKKYYENPHLNVDQQQLYYSLAIPERKEFIKLGILVKSDEELIDVYQKCVDLSIKRESLEEQRRQTAESIKQTRILDETKKSTEEHQKTLEQQNEEAKVLQEAQLFVEQQALKSSNQQNALLAKQNKLIKKNTKEVKKGNDIADRIRRGV